MSTVKILVSRCLQGVACRWDGSSKPSACLQLLPNHWTQLDICPEADLGMGTPRQPISLLREGDQMRLVEFPSMRDWTGSMANWCRMLARVLLNDGVAGAVLKARSPSCGHGDAAVFTHRESLLRQLVEATPAPLLGDGLLVQSLKERDPSFPIIRDEDLWSEPARLVFLKAIEARCGESC